MTQEQPQSETVREWGCRVTDMRQDCDKSETKPDFRTRPSVWTYANWRIVACLLPTRLHSVTRAAQALTSSKTRCRNAATRPSSFSAVGLSGVTWAHCRL